jgi:hypothetical protein
LAPSLPSGWEARRVEAVAAAEFALRICHRLHPTAEQLSSSSSGDDHRFAAPRDWQGDGAGRRAPAGGARRSAGAVSGSLEAQRHGSGTWKAEKVDEETITRIVFFENDFQEF